MHEVGTLATVHKVVRMPNQSRFVFTEGVERVRLVRYAQTEPFMIAEVETMEDVELATSLELRGVGAQCGGAVSADRLRIADAFRRIAHDSGQHRGAQPAGGFRCLFISVPDHGR